MMRYSSRVVTKLQVFTCITPDFKKASVNGKPLYYTQLIDLGRTKG